MPSFVFVWENNTIGHRAVDGYTWPGHASMNIGDFYWEGDRSERYVSWWPGASKSFGAVGLIGAALVPRGLFKRGGSNPDLADDIDVEGYLPDHVIRIDTSDEQERTMRAEWASVVNGWFGGRIKKSYHPLSQNCSTIVARVLLAGGFKTKKWSLDSHWVWSPADVRKLAAKSGTFMQWVDVRTLIRNSGLAVKHRKALNKYMARSGRLCTTGAECEYQKGEPFYWAKDHQLDANLL